MFLKYYCQLAVISQERTTTYLKGCGARNKNGEVASSEIWGGKLLDDIENRFPDIILGSSSGSKGAPSTRPCVIYRR